MRSTAAILLALVLGLLAGALLQANGTGAGFVAAVEPVGPLWVNAIKMTVIPLVLALLVGGIASAGDAAAGGALAARSMTVIAVLLTAAAAFAVIVGLGLLALWPVSAETAAAVRAAAGGGAALPEPPPPAEMLTGLVPSNIFKALADGAMLQIVLFGLLLGFAATRVAPEAQARLAGLARAVADAMMVIVGWIILLAPVGVFALSLSFGYRTGAATAGAILQYVVYSSTCAVAQIALLTLPAASVWGGRNPWRWTLAALPAMTVGFSTQSSLAALPTTIRQARDALKLPEPVVDVTLPLAVTLFKVASLSASIPAVLYAAALYGIELTPLQIASVAALGVIGSVVTVGVSGAASFFAVRLPMFAVAGLPVEILPLMLAVDVIIDMWRTAGNVAGQLTVATIVGRGHDRR